jgi:hypothetical protein
VARLATPKLGRVPDPGPLTERPGPTSSPGSLPAPRVACRCSPAGFDRQQSVNIIGEVIQPEGVRALENFRLGVREEDWVVQAPVENPTPL